MDPRSQEETDVLVHHTLPDGSQPLDPPTPCPATGLDPSQRQRLALDALTGSAPISRIAQQHHVSRKFIYHQAHKAQQALDHAFNPQSPARDDRVLFSPPVTKAWIRQFVLALILIGHSSFRGVTELLRDLFDYHLSVGTVHNIVDQAVATSRQINRRQDLSRIRIGADDEFFQATRPVLVGVDTESTYCYLLSQKEHRDADPWGCASSNSSTAVPLPRPRSPISARGSAPDMSRPCPGSPAAVMSSMRCTNSGRWAATWRIVPTRRSTPAPSSSGSKPPPSGERAGRNRIWPRRSAMRGGPRPGQSRWPRTWRCWPGGCARTSCRWPGRSPPSAARCTTSWWWNCGPASRPVPIGSNPCGNCWRTSGITS